MIRRTTTIHNHLGLHARAAARFVALASEYECDIHVCYGDKRVNGKSIMGLMMLAAGDGAEITLEAEGADAEAAVAALAELVSNGFNEAGSG
ncbi:MAG: HPr family phosphocarrier protein [Halorhodospira sp.]